MLTVEIIGAGTVGEATGRAISHWGHEPIFKDVDEERRQELREQGFETVESGTHVEADLSVICVPTPYDNGYDVSLVWKVIDKLSDHTDLDSRVVAIHSTVLPGTTEEIQDEYDISHIAFVPEFLKQRQALYDALTQETVVIGTESDHAETTIRSVMSGKQEFVRTAPKDAELAKFASNLFAATKISFANQFWRVAEETEGADGDKALEAFRSASPWVEGETGEQGLMGGWPYGGACLPKDSKGFMSWLMENDLYAPQLSGTIEENQIMKNHPDQKDPEVPQE